MNHRAITQSVSIGLLAGLAAVGTASASPELGTLAVTPVGDKDSCKGKDSCKSKDGCQGKDGCGGKKDKKDKS